MRHSLSSSTWHSTGSACVSMIFNLSCRPSNPLFLMDSAVVSQLFKQLFAHRPCTTCAHHVRSSRRMPSASQTRRIQTRPKEKSTLESSWQQRTDHFPQDRLEEWRRYPMVTADQLKTRQERPRRVKMLMRDYIEGQHIYNGVVERKLLKHSDRQSL